MMKKTLLFLLVLAPSSLLAQGVSHINQALYNSSGNARIAASAIITVCAASNINIPCSPPLASTLFKDVLLSVPLSNPFNADANGNYSFYAAPGNYTVTITGVGISGYSYPLSLGITPTTSSQIVQTANLTTQNQTAYTMNLNGGTGVGTYGLLITGTPSGTGSVFPLTINTSTNAGAIGASSPIQTNNTVKGVAAVGPNFGTFLDGNTSQTLQTINYGLLSGSFIGDLGATNLTIPNFYSVLSETPTYTNYSGTMTSLYAYGALSGGAIAGTVHNTYGYFADTLPCGDTICAQFYANTTPAGATNWAFYSVSGKSKFDALQMNSLSSVEQAAPSGVASSDLLWADSTAHRWKMNNNNVGADTVVGTATADVLTNKNTLLSGGPLVGTVASGTATMTTASIGSLACGTTVTVAATHALTTDVIAWAFTAAPAANPGELVISMWPTVDNVNFQYCNPTAGSVTPNAATLNWRVVR